MNTPIFENEKQKQYILNAVTKAIMETEVKEASSTDIMLILENVKNSLNEL